MIFCPARKVQSAKPVLVLADHSKKSSYEPSTYFLDRAHSGGARVAGGEDDVEGVVRDAGGEREVGVAHEQPQVGEACRDRREIAWLGGPVSNEGA